MSYRTVKRLLGETSLERKCRYLFGGGLLLLIVGSFYVYARLTSDLVYEAVHKQAQRLASSIILEKHIEKLEPEEMKPAWDRIIREPASLGGGVHQLPFLQAGQARRRQSRGANTGPAIRRITMPSTPLKSARGRSSTIGPSRRNMASTSISKG